MPQELNWIDILIAIFLAVAMVQGIRTGLIRSIFTIAGLAAGLGAASAYYVEVSSLILGYLNLPAFLADAASFILIFSITTLSVHFLGSLLFLVIRITPLRLIDKLGGGGAGLVIGLAVMGVVLILLISFPLFPGVQDHVEQSTLALQIVDHTHFVLDTFSELLPVELPRLALHPEDLAGYFNNAGALDREIYHHDVDFAALEGTACFVCEGPVEFLGFMNNNKGSYSPKFTCIECGRTSDGCQTYEGYHLMYEQCPVELGNRGYRFDCGIWTNHSYHRPSGPCPTCGTE